jgi:hypothetical protein
LPRVDFPPIHPTMKRFALLSAAVAALAAQAETKTLFDEDFSKVPPGDLPGSFMVLDGQFTVKEDAGNRFVELPGSPLDSFGVLFGTNEADGVQVSARILATKSGRKFPTFAAGLNGVGGYKVRVSPAKGALELVHGDEVKASVPFKWTSGEWTSLRLSVTRQGDGVRISAKAWQGTAEPADWSLNAEESAKLPAGKAGVWGLPFSGTPIRFDDLKVSTAG